MRVDYDANGGVLTGKKEDWVFPGDRVDLTPTATRTDARLLGWHTDPLAKTPLSSFTMPSTAKTLYAVWEEKQTVTYNYTQNFGTRPAGQPTDAKFFKDEIITPLPTATKVDARHLGWNTTWNTKNVLTNIKMLDGGMEIYAIYEDKIQVTYSFTANYGKSVSKANDKFFAGDPVDLSPTAVKDDARFLGWHTNAASKTPLASLTMPTTPLTLHAIFEDKIQVTYNFAYNGGASVSKSTDKFYKNDPVDLSPAASKPGWDFLGWHTNQNATVPLASLAMPDVASLTLYAVYRLTSEIKFVDYDDSGRKERSEFIITYNREVPAPATHSTTAPAQNSPSAWTPLGWTHQTAGAASPTIAPPGGEVPYYAAYYGLYSHPVSLAYDPDGGNLTPKPAVGTRFDNSFDLNNPVNPIFSLAFGIKKAGYAFAGWRDSASNIYPEASNAAFGADTILTAAWDEIRVDGVGLSCYNLDIGTGQSAQITATVSPANAANRNVAWSSSDPAIAAVDQNGVVTAHASGTATITATTQDGGYTAGCEVNVMFVAVPVGEVALSAVDASMFVGEEKQLVCIVLPLDATNTNVTWSSSDPEIATVDQTGKVTGHSVGEAVITIQSRQGGKISTCVVTVNPIPVAGISISRASLSILLGDTSQLNGTVLPASATDKRIAWISSDCD